jgi:hypothetical protein
LARKLATGALPKADEAKNLVGLLAFAQVGV